MKIRRFIGKRRRKERRRRANMMAAKHLCASDRRELAMFERWLLGQLAPAIKAFYESGKI